MIKTRKKILLIYYAPLMPKIMASQDRVINLVKRLAIDHDIHVITSYRTRTQREETKKLLEEMGIKYFPIKAINPQNDIIRRAFLRAIFTLMHYISKIPGDYFYAGNPFFINKIRNIIKKTDYDIIQLEYWYNWKVFNSAGKKTIKVIDTHDVLYEKRRQQLLGSSRKSLSSNEIAVKKYKQLETDAYKTADILLSISENDQKALREINGNCKHILVSSGQEIEYFSEYKVKPEKDIILFYGSMGGRENIEAFFRVYRDIYPLILEKIPTCKLLVVGANPPKDILKLQDTSIIITGFVEDVREYLARANVMLLPLNVAAGFRSRSVEVMAMGIPIIGTHKALDNLCIENGVQGFISDNDKELADRSIELYFNVEKRNAMSTECRKYAKEKYSIDNTFGKLSDYYMSL